MINNVSWRLLDPENSANPEDNFGAWHNEILEYVVNNKFKISNATSNQIRLITEVIKIVIPKAMELTNSTGDRAEIDQAYTLSLASAVQSFGYSNQFFTGEEKDREFKTIWSGIAASIF